MRVELTCRTRGSVIRAWAGDAGGHATLDLATGKVAMGLSRAADRRRVHHGNRTPVSVAAATGAVTAPPVEATVDGAVSEELDPPPFVVREKAHYAAPI